jgi:hypothetical protein
MNGMILLGAFVILSLPIIWVSMRSLRHPTSHGFSRFFAFEGILALIILNLPHWFADPFGVLQLVSWALLGVSLVFVVWGFVLLRRKGGFSPAAEASPNLRLHPPSHVFLTFVSGLGNGPQVCLDQHTAVRCGGLSSPCGNGEDRGG